MPGVPRVFSFIHIALGLTGDTKDIAGQSASLRADALNRKFVLKVFQIFPESIIVSYSLVQSFRAFH